MGHNTRHVPPHMNQEMNPELIDNEWITFPGGELEGKRPKALCPTCRDQLERAAATGRADLRRRGTLCFQCYRAELDREKALKAAGQLDTASPERLQAGLPFEPVNRPRLDRLKADRAAARVTLQAGAGRFADRRRHAQIAARHALQSIAVGLRARQITAADRDRAMADAIHAAELQLPESWLPFVVAR
jgi:hypothetical protein